MTSDELGNVSGEGETGDEELVFTLKGPRVWYRRQRLCLKKCNKEERER